MGTYLCSLTYFTEQAKKSLEMTYIRMPEEERPDGIEKLINLSLQISQNKDQLLIHSTDLAQARVIYLNEKAASENI